MIRTARWMLLTRVLTAAATATAAVLLAARLRHPQNATYSAEFQATALLALGLLVTSGFMEIRRLVSRSPAATEPIVDETPQAAAVTAVAPVRPPRTDGSKPSPRPRDTVQLAGDVDNTPTVPIKAPRAAARVPSLRHRPRPTVYTCDSEPPQAPLTVEMIPIEEARRQMEKLMKVVDEHAFDRGAGAVAGFVPPADDHDTGEQRINGHKLN